MGVKNSTRIGLIILAIVPLHTAWADGMGTAFTYQGELKDGGTPVNDTCDFQFSVWDAPDAGTQIGPTLIFDDAIAEGNSPAITLVDGRFTVRLDFGANSFVGQARWLNIAVCCPTGCGAVPGGLLPLAPRQELTPAPYALALPGLFTLQHPSSPNLIGGYSGNMVEPGAAASTIGGGGSAGSENRVLDSGGTVGGGSANTAGSDDGNPASAQLATVGGGLLNTSTQPFATVGGGQVNTASGINATIGGGQGNTAGGRSSTVAGGEINTAAGDYDTVGGGRSNVVSADYGTIAGGGEETPGEPFTGNRVFDNYGTVGGGGRNRAGSSDSDPETARFATVAGGNDNWATAFASTVGGGFQNRVTGTHAFVGGGNTNFAAGSNSVVGGGRSNSAAGTSATVPGGQNNIAGGDFSFAAGRLAHASHDGAFVWADNSAPGFRFTSTGPNQFLIRAAGGVGIGTTEPRAKLHIGGTPGVDGIRFPDDTLQTTAATGGGGSGDGHSLDAADGDPVNVVFVDNDGNVGIGTDTPNTKLTIDAGGSTVRMFNLGSSTGEVHISSPGGAPGIAGFANNGNRSDIRFTDSGMRLLTSSTSGIPGLGSGITIAEDGNVGIGNSDPEQKLDVAGHLKFSAENPRILGGTGVLPFSIYGNNNASDSLSWMEFWGDDPGGTRDGELALAGSKITFRHNSTDSTIGTVGMVLDQDGNVGIGDTTPDFPLSFPNTLGDKISLWGDSGDHFGLGIQSGTLQIHTKLSTERIVFGFGSSDSLTETMRIQGNGRVGIGTTNPTTDLDITSESTNFTGLQLKNTSTDQRYLMSVIGSGVANREGNFEIWATTTGENHNVFTATPEGQVGIGTTTPGAMLDIAVGNKRIHFRHEGDSQVASLNVTGSGNAVGVLRMRNALELWPNDAGTVAGTVDVRDESGVRTILMTGADGRISAKVLQITGADLAEKFPTSEPAQPGTVMEIDPANPGKLRVARGAYNRRVAGVVSGANGLSVGVILGNLPGSEDSPAIAMSGRVWAQCDTSNGPIDPGDLLTTSATPGQAMKVTDYTKAQGAILGKAMTHLKSGKGLVLVLVSLQ
ncbi:MAG: hypothetical protein V3W34_01660 [Phycisphaerae bacterium]